MLLELEKFLASHQQIVNIFTSVLGPTLVFIGFFQTLKQVKIAGDNSRLAKEQAIKQQNWKEIEFLAAQVSYFNENEDIRKILKILDWSTRSIPLTIHHESRSATEDKESATKEIIVRITRPLLTSAMRTQKDGQSPVFSAEETAIRDLMDYFLANLGRFNHFVEAGAMTKESLIPYLGYWIDLLLGRKSEIMSSQNAFEIREYMNFYNFVSAEALLARYGSPVLPPTMPGKNQGSVSGKNQT